MYAFKRAPPPSNHHICTKKSIAVILQPPDMICVQPAKWIEESICDIIGIFRPPQWFGARGIFPPLSPSLGSCCRQNYQVGLFSSPKFRNMALIQGGWPRKFHFVFWPFLHCKSFLWRKIFTIPFFGQHFYKIFVINTILDRCSRSDVGKIWVMRDSKKMFA